MRCLPIVGYRLLKITSFLPLQPVVPSMCRNLIVKSCKNFATLCAKRVSLLLKVKPSNIALDAKLNELKRTLKQFSAIATKVQKRQNRVLLIAKLESDLNEAIHAEDFELCASIREQINNIILNVKTKQEQ